MVKITQYPKTSDGRPMDMQVGFLTDATGNQGARLLSTPSSPDGAPIEAIGLVIVDETGTPAVLGDAEVSLPAYTDFNAMQAYRLSVAINGYTYSAGLPRAKIPLGVFAQAGVLDFYGGGIFEGESGSVSGTGSSVLTFPLNSTGIRIQFYNAEGEHGYNAARTIHTSGNILRQVVLKGFNSGNDAEHPGIRIRSPSVIEDFYIEGFAGDGINATCQLQTLGADYGNASASQIYRGFIQLCKNGIKFEGPDANIFTVLGCSMVSCREYGYVDGTLLGGLGIGLHCANNTLGNYHTVTSVDTAGAFPTLLHCYSESGSPACTFSPNTLRVGGSWNGDEVGGGYIYAYGNRIRVNALTCDGPATVRGNQIDIGPNSGGAADLTINLQNMNTETGLWFLRGAGGAIDGYIRNIGGVKYISATAGIHLRHNGADTLTTVAGGVDLPAGKVLSVAGTQVVGAQGAAVADPAGLTSVNATNAAAAPTQAEFNAFVAEFNKLRTDLGATRTQLMAALARLRAATGHGLIA